MQSEFAADYAVWVFFNAIGVMQITAAYNGLLGLLFLRGRPRLTIALGAAVVVASFTWYFASGNRNRPDTGIGLDANTQAFLFALSVGGAIVVTFALTSLINRRWAERWDASAGPPPEGIGWLERTTFWSALAARVRYLRRARSPVP